MAQFNGESTKGSEQNNFIAYVDSELKTERIGHYDFTAETVQPLAFASDTPLHNLYQVIEAGEGHKFVRRGEPFAASSVRILPPISGRDVLAIGKNYAEHAVEFNKSGYDSSDKTDQPTHPVFFTKRATSIIAHEDLINPHPGFTETADYEGEIGVIIGKCGFGISEQQAMGYVWGYTIINDVTARERQRDHKQFFIGKSPDTFCPMGPVAVQKENLPSVLRVQTHVNGEPRQDSTTESLIFSIPYLIKVFSEAQTIQPGDVIATGTPAGVGFGLDPPKFLGPGDEVRVTVTGLGTLRNKVGGKESAQLATKNLAQNDHLGLGNGARSLGVPLTNINSKQLYYKNMGNISGRPIVFVHGLGGTMEYFRPVIDTLDLCKTYSLHLFDLEGQGLSPTSPLSKLTIGSFACDLHGMFKHANINQDSGATLIAHSLGCLVALEFAAKNPSLVHKLVLLGPPPSPLPEAASKGPLARAETVRSGGMPAVVDAVGSDRISEATKSKNPLALAAVRMLLLSQDPESYAKACTALGEATFEIPIENITATTLTITGEEDTIGPPAIGEEYRSRLKASVEPVVLKDVGHWHVFEDCAAVSRAIDDFLQRS